jgi:hypothetical protein
MGIPKCFLKGMQVIHSSQPFDSENLVAFSLHSKHQARADGLPIKDDRARATHAVLTADMRSSQTKLVAQEIAQQQTWLNGTFVASAVHGDGHIEKIAHE